jgi:glycosyltransferase involved in cell wall biosynthesis
MTYFKGVTLLVTHYNRSHSLEKLLQTFTDLGVQFEDIVVSDDGSKPEHLQYVHELNTRYNFRLVTTPINKGLGNNINKGQDAVKTPYVLYIQEDFTPKPLFPEKLKEALIFMEEDQELDLVRFYAYFKYPYLKPFKNGFSQIIFSAYPWYFSYKKFYSYSDHPHLRRSSFLHDFGRYREDLNGDKTEMNMSLSFIKNEGKCLFYEDHYSLLTQENSENEPSTATYRKEWRQQETPLVLAVRWFYLKYKFLKLNYQLLSTAKIHRNN